MCVSLPKFGLSSSCDIQNASREYNLGVTAIVILLQDTAYCLWVGVVKTNVSVVANWHNWLSYFMCSYNNLNLPLGFNDINSLFHICSSGNFYDIDSNKVQKSLPY